MEMPIEPNPQDCCNSGCNPCIFDLYEKQLKLYKKYLEDGKCVNKSEINGISQLSYTKFKVVKNVILCNLHNLITFKRQNLDDRKVWWSPGDHFLYKYITTTEKSCTRAYTPVKVGIQNEGYDFCIVVKKYLNGLVSSHLCNLNEGDVTAWRGPYGHYTFESNKYKRIIMIAQGTGIAPFISIINSILCNEEDMTIVTLLYCCKCVNTILFRDELYSFKSYWNFNYKIFISNCSTSRNFECKYQEPINNHKLSFDYLYNLKPFSSSDQFLICGSLQFNEDYDNYLSNQVPEIVNKVLF